MDRRLFEQSYASVGEMLRWVGGYPIYGNFEQCSELQRAGGHSPPTTEFQSN